MSYITKKYIVDYILNVLDRFGRTDEDRADEDWLSAAIDGYRERFIIAQYNKEKTIDRTWLTDMGIQTFHDVNFADDPNVTYCCSDISKCFIPNVISLTKDGIDLGVYSVISACGTKEYFPFPMNTWKNIPKEHVRSKFRYHDRINTALYTNQKGAGLRLVLLLSSPEDGYLINSAPVTVIVTGTVYVVKGGTVVYNGAIYNSGDTFTGDGTTSFTGNGKVYLQSQLVALSETQPYPVSRDMAQAIAQSILTVEFGIEDKQESDEVNDSADDQTKE